MSTDDAESLRVVFGNSNRLTPFACAKCGRHFSSTKTMHTHVRRVHDALNCAHIGGGTPSTDDSVVADHRPYTCDQCAKTFTSAGNCRAHEISKHSDAKQYACPVCTKLFKWKSNVSNHVRSVHSEPHVRPFVCTLCARTFKTADNMRDHTRSTHTVDKPYECDVCWKRFAWKTSVVNHKRRMHDAPDYKTVGSFDLKLN